MAGYFMISLDCEGKWGMADKLTPHQHRVITDEGLARVYRDIVALFGRYDIPATFAFVMALTLGAEERRKVAPLFAADDGRDGGWLSHFRAFEATGELEGWFQPESLEIVRRHAQHEIACHGFCHRPISDALASAEEARRELDAAVEVARHKGLELRTFVYPRNQVGNLPVLAEKGFLGYRDQRRRNGILGRAASLAEEFDIWPHPEPVAVPSPGEPVCIPAGYFFNWRFGARRLVPQPVTVRRWKTLLDRTAARGGVAHLWLHPHNLLTAPQTKDVLEPVLAYAAKLAADRRLKVVTQEEYCRTILSQKI